MTLPKRETIMMSRVVHAMGFVKRNVRKVKVGKDQEKAQSEKDSHSKIRGGKKPN